MHKRDFNFWIRYHEGKIKRKLTKEEYSEIRASDFAMYLLIPEKALLNVCGGKENFAKIDTYYNYSLIKELANYFEVPAEVMLIRVSSMLKKIELENLKKERNRTRVLQKKNNVFYVKFKK